MHSGDMTELGGANLTDAEREALLEVMQRAKVYPRLDTVLEDTDARMYVSCVLLLSRSLMRRRREP